MHCVLSILRMSKLASSRCIVRLVNLVQHYQIFLYIRILSYLYSTYTIHIRLYILIRSFIKVPCLDCVYLGNISCRCYLSCRLICQVGALFLLIQLNCRTTGHSKYIWKRKGKSESWFDRFFMDWYISQIDKKSDELVIFHFFLLELVQLSKPAAWSYSSCMTIVMLRAADRKALRLNLSSIQSLAVCFIRVKK